MKKNAYEKRRQELLDSGGMTEAILKCDEQTPEEALKTAHLNLCYAHLLFSLQRLRCSQSQIQLSKEIDQILDGKPSE